MTDKQKAEAFDLIASGDVTGMFLFYKRFNKMQKLAATNQSDVMREMGKLAAEEASMLALGHSLE